MENTYWLAVQSELLPMKEAELEAFTPVLAKIIRVLEWVRVEEFVRVTIQLKNAPFEHLCDITRRAKAA